jgi:hypothetical protein
VEDQVSARITSGIGALYASRHLEAVQPDARLRRFRGQGFPSIGQKEKVMASYSGRAWTLESGVSIN